MRLLYLICRQCGRRELFVAETVEEAIRQAAEAGWRWDLCPTCAVRDRNETGREDPS